MEHLVKMFYRVISGHDALDTTLASITSLSENKSTGSSSLTDRDRRRVLDFPDPDHESAALAASSSLTKPELLRHAAESPQDLTDSEIELLRNRYWEDPPREALKVRGDAHRVLGGEIGPLMSRLEEIRAPLYEENEAYALENITTEWVRRMMSTSQAERAAEDEAALARAWPWVRRLWDEDETRSIWGYAFFVVPGIDEVRLEDYRCRFGAVIQWAYTSVGCPPSLAMQWRQQNLAWPGDEDGQSLTSLDDAPVEIFHNLRNTFVTARDIEGDGGLKGRIQRYVFLVIDQDAVDSVLSRDRIVDNMWVWAVDPDFTPADTDGTTDGGGGQRYRGFMRVRIQQLVHNFFNLRHFHGEEFPMSDLWAAAQRSRGGLFVSVDPAESDLWTPTRDVGSALRSPR